MNSLEIAKKLAEITGRPLSDFVKEEDLNNEKQLEVQEVEEADSEVIEPEVSTVWNTGQTEYNTDKPVDTKKKEIVDWPQAVKDYAKLFDATISDNGYIMYGRQMTKKEYNKFTKGLSKEEIMAHPLLYKMFRAEGQTEGFYLRWLDRFRDSYE